ncbi:porin family protein [Fulvivirga lutea]|uniref:PorT family protein n=1 Tax=Fulvivirga lutea TaxID=2810512 RepID=A0A974WHY5_9BACT|nr:porin family protein [Fulvivirga lutea]QSE96440.1 PorT family protein [Fulvivirga lutea]
MKIIYTLMALVCVSATVGYAQDNSTGNDNKVDNSSEPRAYVGVKIGTNYSNVYDSDGESFKADPKFGLAVGAFITIPIGEFLGVQPEILFSQKGYKAEGELLGSSYTITRTSNYLDIPLLVAVKPVKFLTILAGPQYSYLLSQKNKFENGQTTIEQEDEFDNEDLRKNTLCFTGGVDINLDKLVVSGRLGWDLFKNNGDGSTTTPQYKNAWYQLTLGYRL